MYFSHMTTLLILCEFHIMHPNHNPSQSFRALPPYDLFPLMTSSLKKKEVKGKQTKSTLSYLYTHGKYFDYTIMYTFFDISEDLKDGAGFHSSLQPQSQSEVRSEYEAHSYYPTPRMAKETLCLLA